CKGQQRFLLRGPIPRTDSSFCREPPHATLVPQRYCRFPVDHRRSSASTLPIFRVRNEPRLLCPISSRASPASLPAIVSVIRAMAGCACCGSRDDLLEIVRRCCFPPNRAHRCVSV